MTINHNERHRRREALAGLVEATITLRKNVEAAIAHPSDDFIDGWRIVRIPMAAFGVEIRLAESLRERVAYNMPTERAESVVIAVKRGKLQITYDGIDKPIEADANTPPFVLPGGIARTSLVSVHPCTVFCVILGGANDGSAVDR